MDRRPAIRHALLRVPRAARRLAAVAATVGIAAAAAACSEVGPEGEPFSIAFDELPYPSVVVGDTLRGPEGNVQMLMATVFGPDDDPLPDADVRFVPLDSGVRITDDDYAIGQTFGESVRIVAVTNSLQSVPLTLFVTRRPDALRATGDTEIPLEYSPGEVVTSQLLQVRVVHATPSAPGDTVVPGWVVNYEVLGQAPGDTVPGYLIQGQGTARATADTTDAAGLAALRFRLNSATLPVLQDTVEVRATASYKGQPLPGSPVTFHLLIRPRTTS